jgi:lysophospholipase L1-like esterase
MIMNKSLVLIVFSFAAIGVLFAAEDDRPIVDASKIAPEHAANAALPTLHLVGDSTVKSGGSKGMFGWGERLAPFFDTNKINVVNHAIGGRSARTYFTEGRWARVAAQVRPGDTVIIQFGHNDQGRIGDPANKNRADGKGIGDETVEDTLPDGTKEQVHTFGWYLTRMVTNAQARGATVILCSPIPHKQRWETERDFASVAEWDELVARKHNALFLDLTLVVSDTYKNIGREKVEPLFADKGTHTTDAGARTNAICVVAGLNSLKASPLADMFSSAGSAIAPYQPSHFQFCFGDGRTQPGWTAMTPTNFYSAKTGFGFEPGAELTGQDYLTSEKPFLFSVKLPEGNYAVTVLMNDKEGKAVTTVKAEQRRLMLEKIQNKPGTLATRTFIAHVHTPRISDKEQVKLKKRELDTEKINWDDKLTLEFNGTHPTLRALVIAPTNVPTIYLAGDSTVCDQPAEPWSSWGQMLPRFFQPDVAVANYAQSGESIKSSLGANRFEKIFSAMKPGDYLFLQFGHNDMKDKAANALATYKANLKNIVERTRKLGGTPVLVTSMERKAGVEKNTLAGYPDTVRDVAKEDNVALIDLHAMSKVFYQALGADLDKAFQDGTHHNNYGSYELARCIVLGIQQAKLPLASSIVAGFSFDPAKPDDVNTFSLPASPTVSADKPLGN